VTDYFAAFGEKRKPWLDPDSLKKQFLALSAELHPDRSHNAGEQGRRAGELRYTEINAAYRCLREPRTRLAHFLELETGHPQSPVQTVPGELMPLFMEMTTALRQADAMIHEKNAATSALERAQIFGKAQDLLEALQSCQARIVKWEAELVEKTRQISAEWDAFRGAGETRAAMLGELEKIRHLLGYLAKWNAQLPEKSFQLTN
jgi:DnaJ-domain-containing protein 1